jgi:hypothetical protein
MPKSISYDNFSLLKSIIFWDLTPCSPLNVNRRFGGTYRLHLQGRKISSACHLLSRCFFCSTYSSTLKMEAICSSETSVDSQRTKRRYIPEDSTLHNRRCENPRCFCIYLFSRFIFVMEFMVIWGATEPVVVAVTF